MNLVARLSKLERNRGRCTDAFGHLSDDELTARIDELDRSVMAAADLSQSQLARLQRETTRKPALLEPHALAVLLASIKQEAEAHA
ncbi:MAG: hypothetical protein KL840_21845 [Aquamicrobium sp.]|nr:hypothetical protein [Aquamicrobium sp.]